MTCATAAPGVIRAAASGDEYDVTIVFTYNDVYVCTHHTEVLAPIALPDSINYGDWENGFMTHYHMRVQDKLFGNEMPLMFEVNEQFGDFVSDYQGEDWNAPFVSYCWTDPLSGDRQAFPDSYHYANHSATPPTVHHDDTNAGVEVQHGPQYYHGGSLTIGSGYLMKYHKLQYYRGKGDQLELLP